MAAACRPWRRAPRGLALEDRVPERWRRGTRPRNARRSARSALASTISMFDSTGGEEGPLVQHFLAAARARPGRPASHSLGRTRRPYQPGSIRRHCAQEKTHGIARQPLDRAGLRARSPGGLPMLSSADLADHGGHPRRSLESRRLVDETAIRRKAEADRASIVSSVFGSRGAIGAAEQKDASSGAAARISRLPVPPPGSSTWRRSPHPAR